MSIPMCALCVLAMAAASTAQTVSEKLGNVFFSDADGQQHRLTSSGIDSQPSLSPDRKHVVFVRRGAGETIPRRAGDGEPNEIWLVDVGGENPHRLVAPRAHQKVERILADLARLQFASDSRTVFFESWPGNWSAVHRIDIQTEQERLVTDGNNFTVVHLVDYGNRDYILVSRHKYFVFGAPTTQPRAAYHPTWKRGTMQTT